MGLCLDSISVLIKRDAGELACYVSSIIYLSIYHRSMHPSIISPSLLLSIYLSVSVSSALAQLYEDSVRRWPSASQEESSHQKPTMHAFWSWASNPQTCEKINSYCVSPPKKMFLTTRVKFTRRNEALGYWCYFPGIFPNIGILEIILKVLLS